MKKYDIEQGSEEWHKLRLGKSTASNMHMIISPTGEKSKQADKYINQLIAEQITGESAEAFKGKCSYGARQSMGARGCKLLRDDP